MAEARGIKTYQLNTFLYTSNKLLGLKVTRYYCSQWLTEHLAVNLIKYMQDLDIENYLGPMKAIPKGLTRGRVIPCPGWWLKK